MGESEIKYMRCANCGRFYVKQDSAVSQFCGEECAQSYTCCQNCGDYFIPKEEEELFCSAICAADFPIPKKPHTNNYGRSKR